SIMLGVDVVGIIGQQGLRAARGSPAVVSGLLARVVRKAREGLYLSRDVDFLAQAMADGLQAGAAGRTADIRRGPIERIPYLGDATEAAQSLQFEKGLGAVRLRAYEGLLLQNKILHMLSGGLLGGDITKPSVRRHIAEFANTLGSTSRAATGARRQGIESRAL